MRISYQNCRGVKTKLDRLRCNLLLSDNEIVVLTETWLNMSVYSSEFSTNKWNIFRKDRDPILTGKSQGGGVLIGVNNVYNSVECNIFVPEMEAICVCVSLNSFKCLYVVVVYFPPNCDINLYHSFYEAIERNLSGKMYIILGDFNIPSYIDVASTSEVLLNLKGFLAFNNLQQLNTILNKNNVILDLILSVSDNVLVDDDDDPLLPEDPHHPGLIVVIPKMYPRYRECKRAVSYKYNFRKANFTKMYNLFKNQSWNSLKNTPDVNVALTIFYQTIYNIFEQCVPKSISSTKKYPL